MPRYRLPAKEVARVWTGGKGGLPIKEKAVPGLDEDVATMSIEAARNAMARASIDPHELRAVWVGSESHPYAVKPTSTLVAEAIGAVPSTQAADWEFACKAGTEALVAAMALVGSGMGHYAMAIGMDTAQGKPGDALEYTAGAGGAAFIVGPADEALGRHSWILFICDRHAGFLASSGGQVSGAWNALHGRARLFQAHHRGGHPSDAGLRYYRQRTTSGRSSTSRIRNFRSAWPRNLGFPRRRSSRAYWCRSSGIPMRARR